MDIFCGLFGIAFTMSSTDVYVDSQQRENLSDVLEHLIMSGDIDGVKKIQKVIVVIWI